MKKKHHRRLIVICALAAMGLILILIQFRTVYRVEDPSAEDLQRSLQGQISPYDQIMRQVGLEEGIDWRLLAAVAHSESRFNPEIISPKGAKGLMQIMPIVAREYGVSWEEVEDPWTNVRLGAQLLNNIESRLKFSSKTSKEDRLSIILAAYNAGIGHVFDARRVAASEGKNYNSWEVLKDYLRIKGEKDWVDGELVRNGSFNAGETVGFVRKTMRQYGKYKEKYM